MNKTNIYQPKESEIQKSIIDYVNYKNHFVWKSNTAGIYVKATGQYIPSPAVGCPDIVGIAEDGNFIGIEVKRKGKKTTLLQDIFLEKLRYRGGIVIVAHSLEEVERIL